MNKIVSVFLLSALFAVSSIGQVTNTIKRYSDYPNTNLPAVGDLFLIASTNLSPHTNLSVKYSDLKTAITNGLTPISYANNVATNGSNYALFQAQDYSTNATNWAQNLSTNGSNYAFSLGATWTNFSRQVATNATNYSDLAASNRVTVAAGANITVTTNGSGGQSIYTIAGSAGGGVTPTFDATQFAPGTSGTNIKSGAPFTNTVLRGTSTASTFNWQSSAGLNSTHHLFTDGVGRELMELQQWGSGTSGSNGCVAMFGYDSNVSDSYANIGEFRVNFPIIGGDSRLWTTQIKMLDSAGAQGGYLLESTRLGPDWQTRVGSHAFLHTRVIDQFGHHAFGWLDKIGGYNLSDVSPGYHPLAWVEIAGQTDVTNCAALRLVPGLLCTNAAAGSIETDGTNFYATVTNAGALVRLPFTLAGQSSNYVTVAAGANITVTTNVNGSTQTVYTVAGGAGSGGQPVSQMLTNYGQVQLLGSNNLEQLDFNLGRTIYITNILGGVQLTNFFTNAYNGAEIDLHWQGGITNIGLTWPTTTPGYTINWLSGTNTLSRSNKWCEINVKALIYGNPLVTNLNINFVEQP